MTVYFVTVLLMLNVLPPLGWIQHTFAYTDKKLCEQYINEYKEEISLSLKANFGSTLVGIKQFECMTYEQAIKRNSELGH